jgi:hypothetical protein
MASSQVFDSSRTLSGSAVSELAGMTSTKSLREVYVGNCPPGTTGPQLLTFLNQFLVSSGHVLPGTFPNAVGGDLASQGPVIACRLSPGSNFGFAEFRTVEEAVLAIALGELSKGNLNLKFGRPRGYISLYGDDAGYAPAQADEIRDAVSAGKIPSSTLPGAPAGVVLAVTLERVKRLAPSADASSSLPASATFAAVTSGPYSADASSAAALVQSETSRPSSAPAQAQAPAPDRSCPSLDAVGGIELMTEADLREMFSGFGTIRRCELIQEDGSTRAVIEMSSLAEAELAQQSLNGLSIGSVSMSVRNMNVDEQYACAKSRFVLLRNTVLRDEVKDPKDWEEVQEDIASEANKYGTVVSMHVPAKDVSSILSLKGDAPDAVPIVVEFEAEPGAVAAAQKLNNRRFDGRLVTAHCIDESVAKAALE